MLFGANITLQSLYIGFESRYAPGSNSTGCKRVVIAKRFFYFDITGLFQFIKLRAQVAGSCPRFFPDISKIGLFQRYKQGNYSKS